MSDLSPEDQIAALVQLSRAQIVRAIFPEAGKYTPEGIPGRSWPVGRLPPGEPTPLDNHVKKLLNRTRDPRILSPEELAERGLECPYYAVRFLTAISLIKATHDHFALYDDRIRRLEAQKEDLETRLNNGRKILKKHSYLDVMQSGNPLWLPAPEFEEQRANVENAGHRFFSGIVEDLKNTKKYLDYVNGELGRLKPGERVADTWKTSLVFSMGMVYCAITGKRTPPEDREPFKDLLRAATATAGGEKLRVEAWGQTKTILKNLKEAKPGEGFDAGASGSLSMHSIAMIANRGPEILNIIKMTDLTAEDEQFIVGNAGAILLLKDRDDAPENIVLRETVLKPTLVREGLNTPALLAQLGWQNDQRHEVKSALLSLIEEAHRGSATAIATLALSQDTGELIVKDILDSSRFEPFEIMDKCELMYRLHHRIGEFDRTKNALSSLLRTTIPGCDDAVVIARERMRIEDREAFAKLEQAEQAVLAQQDASRNNRSKPGPKDIVKRYPRYQIDI